MKTILFSVALVLSSISTLAQEVDTCFTFDVPPLYQIGNAPAQKNYLQVSEGLANQTMLKIVSPNTGMGIGLYFSMCKASRSDISCKAPDMGSGAVQILIKERTINLYDVRLKMVESTVATKILGTKANLKLTSIDCSEFVKIAQ